MNSATGLEFAYTQAPPSMKSVVQSFWLLTTCLGNIIDIFFVEIQLWDTQVRLVKARLETQIQTGEYFILAMIMFAAAMIFAGLSIFYYDYVPEDAFNEAPKSEESDKAKEAEMTKEADIEAGKSNDGYESDEL